MAVTAYVEQTALTITTSEKSLISGTTTLQNDTTAGAFQVVVDGIANMAKGDRIRLKIKEKARSGGTQRTLFEAELYNAQTELYITPTIMLLNGWDVTLIKIAGTDRAVDTSIRKAG